MLGMSASTSLATRSAEQCAARLERVLWLWHAADGLPGGRQLRLRAREALPGSASQGAVARHAPLLGRGGVWGTWRAAAAPSSPWRAAVSLEVKPVGKPDAGNPHVRFDERGRETERCHRPKPPRPSSTLRWGPKATRAGPERPTNEAP